jgi:hypothetical protein
VPAFFFEKTNGEKLMGTYAHVRITIDPHGKTRTISAQPDVRATRLSGA